MPRARPPRPRATRRAPKTATTPADTSPATPAPKARAKPPEPRRAPQPEPDPGFVAVGRVLAPFGLRGELKVQSLTDNPARFRAGARLHAGTEPVTVAKAREAQGYVYVTLRGVADRTAGERFRHRILQVPESEMPALAEGEYYRFQLVGLTVVDRDGRTIGTLEEVIETGANDVYRVRTADGADVLLPALDDVILSINLEEGRMVVDPPEWR